MILLVVKQEKKIALYVAPDWQGRISDADRAYMNELIEDIAARSLLHPNELFEQLRQLSVGPIVTDCTAAIDLQNVRIEDIYPGFRLYG